MTVTLLYDVTALCNSNSNIVYLLNISFYAYHPQGVIIKLKLGFESALACSVQRVLHLHNKELM